MGLGFVVLVESLEGFEELCAGPVPDFGQPLLWSKGRRCHAQLATPKVPAPASLASQEAQQ